MRFNRWFSWLHLRRYYDSWLCASTLCLIWIFTASARRSKQTRTRDRTQKSIMCNSIYIQSDFHVNSMILYAVAFHHFEHKSMLTVAIFFAQFPIESFDELKWNFEAFTFALRLFLIAKSYEKIPLCKRHLNTISVWRDWNHGGQNVDEKIMRILRRLSNWQSNFIRRWLNWNCVRV